MQVVFTLYLLYVQVSVAFLTGLAITLALIPINMVLANKIQRVNSELMRQNDERVLRLSEMLRNMKCIKMCGWALKLHAWLVEPRQKYMVCLRWVKMLDAWCVFFWATTPVLVSLATFATYVWIGGSLTPGRAAAALALFVALIMPLNAYPWVINGAIEATVSGKRLATFFVWPSCGRLHILCADKRATGCSRAARCDSHSRSSRHTRWCRWKTDIRSILDCFLWAICSCYRYPGKREKHRPCCRGL